MPEYGYSDAETASSMTCPYASSSTGPKRNSFESGTSGFSDVTASSQTPLQSSATSHQSIPAPTASACPVFTQEIDPILLRASLEDRMAYLTDFLNFTSRDAEVITKIAPQVEGMIPSLVDEIYIKLFEFDITKKVFMTRNQGFDGPLPEKLEDLTLDSPQIVFRKVFMKAWARRVLTADYTNNRTWAYMDKVGIMHTGVSPFKHQRTMGIAPLNVPYRDCALTLSLVQNVIQSAILQLPESTASLTEKVEAIGAITKVIWIQNDLFARHYINE